MKKKHGNRIKGDVMKKPTLAKIFFAVVFTVIVCAGIYPQSLNHEQRIVGTWKYSGGWAYDIEPWVFNPDGSMSGSVLLDANDSNMWSFYSYAAASDKLLLKHERGAGGDVLCEFYISADGKTLIIIIEENNEKGQKVKRGLPFRRQS
jgi:hypothetical protein